MSPLSQQQSFTFDPSSPLILPPENDDNDILVPATPPAPPQRQAVSVIDLRNAHFKIREAGHVLLTNNQMLKILETNDDDSIQDPDDFPKSSQKSSSEPRSDDTSKVDSSDSDMEISEDESWVNARAKSPQEVALEELISFAVKTQQEAQKKLDIINLLLETSCETAPLMKYWRDHPDHSPTPENLLAYNQSNQTNYSYIEFCHYNNKYHIFKTLSQINKLQIFQSRQDIQYYESRNKISSDT